MRPRPWICPDSHACHRRIDITPARLLVFGHEVQALHDPVVGTGNETRREVQVFGLRPQFRAAAESQRHPAVEELLGNAELRELAGPRIAIVEPVRRIGYAARRGKRLSFVAKLRARQVSNIGGQQVLLPHCLAFDEPGLAHLSADVGTEPPEAAVGGVLIAEAEFVIDFP